MQQPIVVRVGHAISRRARADDQARGGARTSVPQKVPNRDARLERGGVPSVQHDLLSALHHRQLALEHVHQLVFITVPMLDR